VCASVFKLKVDELVKSQKTPVIVIPVKTGIQENQLLMDSRFRGSDGLGDFLRDHQGYDQQFSLAVIGKMPARDVFL